MLKLKNSTITKKEVEQIVQKIKKNSLLNHFVGTFSDEENLTAEVREKTILVWKKDSWTSIFYSVFVFNFNAEEKLITIETKRNPLFKTVTILAVLIFIYLIFEKVDYNFSSNSNWRLIFIACIVALLLFGILLLFSRSIRKKQTTEILELLNTSPPQNEISSKNIAFRFISYPLSVFLLLLSIYALFQDKKDNFEPILWIVIILSYLITDIILLYQYKKNAKKNKF